MSKRALKREGYSRKHEQDNARQHRQKRENTENSLVDLA